MRGSELIANRGFEKKWFFVFCVGVDVMYHDISQTTKTMLASVTSASESSLSLEDQADDLLIPSDFIDSNADGGISSSDHSAKYIVRRLKEDTLL